MTAEASCIRDIRRQRRMGILGTFPDVTREATTAPAARDADGMVRFRLAQVTAGALLAQHRVRNRVAERLQVLRVLGPGMTVDDRACRVHHATRRMHQALADGRGAFRMAGTAGLCRIVEVTRECHKARVGIRLRSGRAVAGMANRAICGGEGMARMETRALSLMATEAAIVFRLCQRRWNRDQQGREAEQGD